MKKMYADKAIHVIQMLTTMKSKVITSKDSLECQKQYYSNHMSCRLILLFVQYKF